MSSVQFASASSMETDVDSAVAHLVSQVLIQLGEDPVDLAVLFLSNHFTEHARSLVTAIREELAPGCILGCTAEGIVAREHEIEDKPAISMIAAHLPDVVLTPFLLQADNWPVLLLDEDELRRRVDAPEDTRLFITLADPLSTPMDDVLHVFNRYFPNVPMAGGMTSGALRPDGNVLFVDDRMVTRGLVGVAISGAVEVDVVVSQGCRPIWQPFIVQSALKNIIYNLEGQPPLAWIQDLVPELSEEDRTLLQGGLFVGRVVDPQQDKLGRGDFLIRGVIGVDQQNGSITIGDTVQEGERVQFHLRDAVTAMEDLEMMLIPQSFRQPAAGGLAFLCNGRGTRLYDHADGDISIIQSNLGNIPIAGFFAAGEIGPLCGRNFLHGHTVSLVLFRPRAV